MKLGVGAFVLRQRIRLLTDKKCSDVFGDVRTEFALEKAIESGERECALCTDEHLRPICAGERKIEFREGARITASAEQFKPIARIKTPRANAHRIHIMVSTQINERPIISHDCLTF